LSMGSQVMPPYSYMVLYGSPRVRYLARVPCPQLTPLGVYARKPR
jgi:hypothetical protein